MRIMMHTAATVRLAALALCALLACGAQASGDSGGSPDFARQYALDAVHYLVERDSLQSAENLTNIYTGMKYFANKAREPFWAILPKLDHEAGYSKLLWTESRIEATEDELAGEILQHLCGAPGAKERPLMVDVGSNIGWYSLLALANGCRVIAIDGSADVLAALNMSLALNGWTDRATLHHAVASGEAAVSYNGWNAEPVGAGASHPSGYRVNATGAAKSFASQTPLALDDIIDEEVAYLKVDVESHEPSVFRSALRLIGARRVKYVLFEWTYFIGGRYRFSTYGQDVLKPLFAADYRCFFAATGKDFKEITADTLLLAVERLHAFCAALERAGAFPAGHQWCMQNVVCMRADQTAPTNAPLLTDD